MARSLDDELAKAAGLGPAAQALPAADDAPPVVKARAAARRGKPVGKNLPLLLTLLVLVGAVVALFLKGFQGAAIYAKPVDELVDQRAALAGRKLRVEGELVPGTLLKRDDPCEYRFKIHGPKQQIDVRYAQCVIPDTFRDRPEGGVLVTVEGKLAGDGSGFEATQVMAKCASKYDEKSHKMKGDAPPPVPASL